MKGMGITQFVKKKFEFLKVAAEFVGLLGRLPFVFIGIVYASSGSGKTELCVRIAKMLARFGKVAWLSYEQGHDADLQMAMIRNGMDEVAGQFIPFDPMEKLPKRMEGESMPDLLFRDIVAFLSKKNSPKYVFIDSIDYTGWDTEHYKRLKELFKRKKGIIFISHAKGRSPKLQVSKDIEYDGQFGIYVKDYVAYPVKSRLGGIKPYIIRPDLVAERIENNPKSYPVEVHNVLKEMAA